MIYATSDLHLGHNRAFIYESRGFSSIEEHDQTIINNWNSVVNDNDTVYILGDLMLGADHQYGLNCLNQLNGTIHIIRGNHDVARRWDEYQEIGLIPEGWATILKAEGYKLYLCHYPTETSCLENMAPIRNHLINLHGHTHSKEKFEHGKPYQYNVALDAHNCYPVSLEQIYKDIEQEVQECLQYL